MNSAQHFTNQYLAQTQTQSLTRKTMNEQDVSKFPTNGLFRFKFEIDPIKIGIITVQSKIV